MIKISFDSILKDLEETYRVALSDGLLSLALKTKELQAKCLDMQSIKKVKKPQEKKPLKLMTEEELKELLEE